MQGTSKGVLELKVEGSWHTGWMWCRFVTCSSIAKICFYRFYKHRIHAQYVVVSVSFLGLIGSDNDTNLQNLGETNLPFLETVNPSRTPNHTLAKWSTSYPVPSVAASKASLELHHIQGKRGVWFCGAYQGHWFSASMTFFCQSCYV